MAKNKQEIARGTFMALKPDTAVPLKLEISDGQFKEVKSGNKIVKIRGKRPFVIGLGKNSKGKMIYWFAFFRRGVTLFRPMKEKMAKELLDMSVPAGEVRKFKAPGFKTKDAKKYGLENAAAEPTSPKKVANRQEAIAYLRKKDVYKPRGPNGLVVRPGFKIYTSKTDGSIEKRARKGGKLIAWVSYPKNSD